ncbi:TPA: hypothetical protein QH074_004325 [Enterobacter hormaechei subsp. steigerwaltii]|nr:hypothetical protein [Enterobacter hormaechei subsp. steigerwaltii]
MLCFAAARPVFAVGALAAYLFAFGVWGEFCFNLHHKANASWATALNMSNFSFTVDMHGFGAIYAVALIVAVLVVFAVIGLVTLVKAVLRLSDSAVLGD